jgi:hypothetical protein
MRTGTRTLLAVIVSGLGIYGVMALADGGDDAFLARCIAKGLAYSTGVSHMDYVVLSQANNVVQSKAFVTEWPGSPPQKVYQVQFLSNGKPQGLLCYE